MLPAVDVLDVSDGLDAVVAFTVDLVLSDDDGLFAGVDEDFVTAVDSWLRAGAELVQLGPGVTWALFLADPLVLGLALCVLPVEDVVVVAGGEPPGLTLGETVSLGLPPGLADPLGLPVTVLPLLEPPLAGVAGAVVVAFVLLGTLVVVTVTDGCVDADTQVLSERCAVTPPAGLDGALCAGEAAGETVACPSVAPGPLEGLVMLKAEPRASPTCTMA